jgi:hypothetical protein
LRTLRVSNYDITLVTLLIQETEIVASKAQ